MKMDHDYSSYSIPTPVIKDPRSAIEDIAGDLRTSYQLLSALIGDTEGVREIGEGMLKPDRNISGDAVIGRADAMWALGNALSTRIKDSIILLEAIIDRPRPAPEQEWEALLLQLMRLEARRDAGDRDGALDTAVIAQLRTIYTTRVPNAEAFRKKVELLREEFQDFEFPVEFLDHLIADVEALERR